MEGKIATGFGDDGRKGGGDWLAGGLPLLVAADTGFSYHRKW
jgi:hypothetical protein